MNDIITALVEIGNHKRVVKECEPNIMESLPLKEWMVIRTLRALELFKDEWERVHKNTGAKRKENINEL